MRKDLPGLCCTSCSRTFDVGEGAWRCPCGGLLEVVGFGPTPPSPDDLARRPPTMWRYLEALPVGPDPDVSMGEGLSPLLAAPGWKGSWLKLEFVMPTLSFKDRGAVVLVTVAKAVGAKRLVVDSSGNAGTAVAAYSARAQLPCEVFVPEGTSPGKLQQMQAHGAEVHVVGGDRLAAAEAAIDRLGRGDGARYASHVYDPYFLHGTKTYAYEIWEQTGGRVPPHMLLPLGNGTLLLGAYLGFTELVEARALARVPRLVGVQAEACAPLARAFCDGLTEPADVEPGPTEAEGIAIARPPRGGQCLAAVRATGGEVVTVEETAVAGARAELAARGFFVEPTAAVCWAALHVAGEGGTVVPLCGAGLKSVH